MPLVRRASVTHRLIHPPPEIGRHGLIEIAATAGAEDIQIGLMCEDDGLVDLVPLRLAAGHRVAVGMGPGAGDGLPAGETARRDPEPDARLDLAARIRLAERLGQEGWMTTCRLWLITSA